MKKTLLSIFLMLFIVSIGYLPICFAQDYTTWALPEGATKRLGKGSIRDLQFNPVGSCLAVASTIGIWMYDAHTYQEMALLTAGTGNLEIAKLAFSPNGNTLAGAFGGTIYLWDSITSELKKTLNVHKNGTSSLAFSSDGKTLASASFDEKIYLLNSETGAHLRTLTGHENINPNLGIGPSVVFSPNGHILVSGSEDGTIRLWDTATGELLKTIDAHSQPVYTVAFSPDGLTMASGSKDRTVRLWDTTIGELQKTLIGHSRRINKVLFSPDGQTLISTGWDGTVRLWNTVTGKLRYRKHIETRVNLIDDLAISPDGQTLTCESDEVIYLWESNTSSNWQTHKNYFRSYVVY